MKLLDFLKGEYARHVAGSWTPISADKPWRKSTWWTGSQTAAGIRVDDDSAMNSATAFACTLARAETLASLPAVVYEGLENDQRRKARQNPMYALIHDQPNPQMNSMTWYSLNAKRLVNRGNALSLIEFNGRGIPIALWPVHNSRWEARRRPSQANGQRWNPGDVYYRIWPDDTNRHWDVPADEVLNIVGFDTENGIVARGAVSRIRNEVALDIAEQEYAGSMFRNGALPLGIVKHPWLDDQVQRDNLRADINKMHQGRENWNKVGFLWDKDADWIPLNFNPKDVQAIESRTFTAKTICRGYGVPPAIVQIFDDYKFSTVEAMLKQFVMMRVRPDAICFERAIKSQIFNGIISDGDLFLEFALEGLLRGDSKAQAETAAILRQWGFINADEYRQQNLNANPIPGGAGDVYLAPLNMGPLDMVASGAAASGPPRQRNDDEPDAGGKPAWNKSFVAAIGQVSAQFKGRMNGYDLSADRHAWKVIDAQYARMMGNEINAIKRIAAKGPQGFMLRVEEFYGKFVDPLAEALAVAQPYGGDNLPLILAAGACEESKRQLLTACECDTASFTSAIETCVASWPGRRIESESRPYGELYDERAAA